MITVQETKGSLGIDVDLRIVQFHVTLKVVNVTQIANKEAGMDGNFVNFQVRNGAQSQVEF